LDAEDGISATNPDDLFLLPTMLEVEAVFASLIDQGLLNGFVSHRLKRFAIQGARQKGTLAAGFPQVWAVVRARHDDNVPGWKRRQPSGPFSGAGGRSFGGGQAPGAGTVVRLSGARPVGVGP
ncbi:MAG: hypothetical protein INR71_11405, partial [Terriglobus roseus]|nr:hypothetical protein [Terriglobus roseus]